MFQPYEILRNQEKNWRRIPFNFIKWRYSLQLSFIDVFFLCYEISVLFLLLLFALHIELKINSPPFFRLHIWIKEILFLLLPNRVHNHSWMFSLSFPSKEVFSTVNNSNAFDTGQSFIVCRKKFVCFLWNFISLGSFIKTNHLIKCSMDFIYLFFDRICKRWYLFNLRLLSVLQVNMWYSVDYCRAAKLNLFEKKILCFSNSNFFITFISLY